MGDRRAYIDAALAMISEALGSAPVKQTPVIETAALGFEGPDFLNMAAVFPCSLSPEELLALCKRTEAVLGRTDPPEYAPDGTRIYHSRTIDIDILYYGNLVLDSPALTLPHPQTCTRPFVAELLSAL